MLSIPRWKAEERKMAQSFSNFVSFIDSRFAGFKGQLRGRSGKIYEVEVRVTTKDFPSKEPKIFISPRVGINFHADGSLCLNRLWKPETSTIAREVLLAATYLNDKG